MKKFDVIAFDLDGTLARSKSPLDEEMSGLLSQLLARYKVAVISGGARHQFEIQFLAHLRSSSELLANLFILPTNGATLCEYKGGWIYEQGDEFSPEEKQRIREAFAQAFAETGFVQPEKMYGEQIEDRGTQFTFSALGQQAPVELKEVWDPDHQKREKLLNVLKPLLPEFSVRIGGATSIDITRQGIDKAYGLKKLLAHLNLSPERMLYVGDALFPGGNDAPALTVGAECRSIKDPEETKTVIRELLSQT